MRMRKKKNLESRLNACGELLTVAEPEVKDRRETPVKTSCLELGALFGNSDPVYMEVGCGKGRFACEYAAAHPGRNLLAIEKSANVIVAACEGAAQRGLENVRFLKCSAEYLDCFIPEKSISGIFLNFSCPFPKKGYAKHRLTHRSFLAIYDSLMLPGAEIHMKTDDRGLFEFSVEELSEYGFTLKNVTLDLHNSGFEGNIMTEYETRFTEMDKPIYRLEAYLKD